MKERLVFLDWMKVIGMFCIVWGHLFPSYMTNVLYSFNVPLFFLISGFLGRGKSLRLNSLLIPYLVICASYLILDSYRIMGGVIQFFQSLLRSIGYMLIGYQTTPDGISAAGMWFVYTLVLIKLVFYIVKNKWALLIVTLFCVCLAVYLGPNEYGSSFQNVLICIPFYYAGYIISSYVKIITTFVIKLKDNVWIRGGSILTIILLSCFQIAMSPKNGFVMMYLCGYGNNVIDFFIYAFTGITLVFLLSCMLDSIHPSWIRIISCGTIVILGYQYLPVNMYMHLFKLSGNLKYANSDIVSCIAAVAIIFLFVPIIKLASKFFPIVMGYRKL